MKWSVLVIAFALGSCTCLESKPQHYRKVDFHTHFGSDAAETAMKLMYEQGIDACVNLSGGFPGGGLEEQLATAARYPGKIFVFANLDWNLAQQTDDFPARMAQQLRKAKELGAKGLKIPKALGLIWRDTTGVLLTVDDPRLDVIFNTAGELGMPVAIHTGDPAAFWLPAMPGNERFAELSVHPTWSYDKKAVPSWEALYAALIRRIARHPKTTFISVHFGNAPEFPDMVSKALDEYPNLYIDTAARIPELGRFKPEVLRAVFDKHRDRILFGTDLGVGATPGVLMLGSMGKDPPTETDIERFFKATWRYFETKDKQFDHPTPIQGDWKIDGLGLPRRTLEALYAGNADRLLGVSGAK